MGRYVVQGRKVTTDVVDFIIEVEAEDEEQACSFVENGDYEDDIDMQVGDPDFTVTFEVDVVEPLENEPSDD